MATRRVTPSRKPVSDMPTAITEIAIKMRVWLAADMIAHPADYAQKG